MTKTKVFALVVFALLLTLVAPLSAFMVTCTVDRCAIGPQFMPRRPDLPNSLIVTNGQTVEFPAAATYGYIEVQSGGKLRVSRTRDTAIGFITLAVLPGGDLDVGTQADPIPCNIKVDLMARDVLIDKVRDPFQWGNGLINFGHQSRVGCTKTEKAEATGDLAMGATTVTLKAVPTGWQVGDELLIPDTVQPAVQVAARREAKVTISAINGDTVTLSKPLDFAHPNLTDTDGTTVLLNPRVANLTRNIVIRSENQFGTRGHTAEVGHEATFDLRYNQIVGMGRTLAIALDNASPDATAPSGFKSGGNQEARYAMHAHHTESQPNSSVVGNVMIGNLTTTKWGLSVHGTHDLLVERNLCLDFPGSCIVTEDGYEVRNKLLSNVAVGVAGNKVEAQTNVTLGCPGCEGSAFWLRGIMNTFIGNEAWNSAKGMTIFNQQQKAGSYPSTSGGPLDVVFNHYAATNVPVEMRDNILAVNTFGYEGWAVPRFPHTNLLSVYNSDVEYMNFNSDGIHTYLVNARLIGSFNGKCSYAAHSSLGYVTDFEMDGGRIAGCVVGLSGGGGAAFLKLNKVTFQNDVNIAAVLPRIATFTDVVHVPVAGKPHQYLQAGNTAVWSGVDPLPNTGLDHYFPQLGSRLVVKNHQGVPGADYLLFYNQQLGTNISWYSVPGSTHTSNTPEKGLTMQQSWDKYGLSYEGDVLKPSESITLDGFDGLARKGLTPTQFPMPRAVCTSPTLRLPAVPTASDGVFITCQNTGDSKLASEAMAYSVDGDPISFFFPGDFTNGASRSFWTGAGKHVEPRYHTIKTWRTDKVDTKTIIPASMMTFQYCVGTCDDVPDPTTVAVPNVVGKTKDQAIVDLGAAGLALGKVDPQSNAAPVGQVLSETPNPGMVVAVGSKVDLVVSSGPAMTTVPNVVGHTESSATSLLSAAGLVIGRKDGAASATVPTGSVISQSPAADASVLVGSAVDLVLSTGPPVPTIPAGTYTLKCDELGNCKMTFVKKP